MKRPDLEAIRARAEGCSNDWNVDCGCNAGGMCGCTHDESGVARRRDRSLHPSALNMARHFASTDIPALLAWVERLEGCIGDVLSENECECLARPGGWKVPGSCPHCKLTKATE